MARHVGDVVATMDATFGVDQVAVSARKVRKLVCGVARDLVVRGHPSIEIAEQRERELLRLGERTVLLDRVVGGSEDDDVEFFEAIGAVTQRLALDGSTGCCGLGVPPEQDPVPSKIVERHGVAPVVGKSERGSHRSGYEHDSSLPKTRQGRLAEASRP